MSGQGSKVGEQVGGRFRIRRPVADLPGYVGFDALDEQADERVELWLLRPKLHPSQAQRDLVVRNCTDLMALDHSHVRTVLGVGHHEDTVFVATETASAGGIRRRLETRKPSPEPDIVLYATSVAQALEAVHDRGYVHGRLTPDDVVSVGGLIKVGGSGLFHDLDARAAREMWHLAERYLAPEVREGGRISPASDVYSLAAILVELASGVTSGPIHQGTQALLAESPQLADVLTPALSPAPRHRPSSPAILLKRIRQVLIDDKVPTSRRQAQSAPEIFGRANEFRPFGRVDTEDEVDSSGEVTKRTRRPSVGPVVREKRPEVERRTTTDQIAQLVPPAPRSTPPPGAPDPVRTLTGYAAGVSAPVTGQRQAAPSDTTASMKAQEPPKDTVPSMDAQVPPDDGRRTEPMDVPNIGEERLTEPVDAQPFPSTVEAVEATLENRQARSTEVMDAADLPTPDEPVAEAVLKEAAAQPASPAISSQDAAPVVGQGKRKRRRRMSTQNPLAEPVAAGAAAPPPAIKLLEGTRNAPPRFATVTPEDERRFTEPQLVPPVAELDEATGEYARGEEDSIDEPPTAVVARPRRTSVGTGVGAELPSPKARLSRDSLPLRPEHSDPIGRPSLARPDTEPEPTIDLEEEAPPRKRPRLRSFADGDQPPKRPSGDRYAEPKRADTERGGGNLKIALLSLLVCGVVAASVWLLLTKFGKEREVGEVKAAIDAAPEAAVVVDAQPKVVKPPPKLPPCGDSQVLVTEVGEEEKPFCIDQYEAPGKGSPPDTGMTFEEAGQRCAARGQRLCTREEWTLACRGANRASFPYGTAFVAGKCNVNTQRAGEIAPGGTFMECVSAAGAFDMSGNVAEWASDNKTGGGSALDRTEGRCSQPRWRSQKPRGYPDVGYRCCGEPGAKAAPESPPTVDAGP